MRTPLGFDLARVERIRVNRNAVEARVNRIITRTKFKDESQVDVCFRIIECMDLTTLKGDDTESKVRRMCEKALRPVLPETLNVLEPFTPKGKLLRVAAVCIYPRFIPIAREVLGREFPIAAVVGFPIAGMSRDAALIDTDQAILAGATEIDMVITAEYVHKEQWRELYEQVVAYREVCSDRAKLKVILEVGELGTLTNVAKASVVAIQAGADFIKTSTGFAKINANLPAGLVMARAIRSFWPEQIGLKPAGGIRTAKQAYEWFMLMKKELGPEWMKPGLFRFGASSLLTDAERQLHHLATGRYSAAHHHPMG